MNHLVVLGFVQGSEPRALTHALLTDQTSDAARWTAISSAAKTNCGHEDVIQCSLDDADAILESTPIPFGVAILAENNGNCGKKMVYPPIVVNKKLNKARLFLFILATLECKAFLEIQQKPDMI